MWWHSYDGAKGIVMDCFNFMEGYRQPGACLDKAIDILRQAGSFKPGTGPEGVGYVIRLDDQGEVIGVDVAMMDPVLGAWFRQAPDLHD
jgi:hypothetical protein